MVLLRYRPVIGFRRSGVALLLGLTTGAVLVGGVAMAAPPDVEPTTAQATLGAAIPRAAVPPQPPTVPPTTILLPDVAARSAAAPVVEAPTPPPTPGTTTTTRAAPRPTTTTRAAPAPVAARAPAPAPAPASGSGPAAAVVAGTNAEREAAGCDPLRSDSRLAAAAQGHASDMAANDYFSHTSQDGRAFDERIRAAGHPSPGGENIAKGQRSAAEVVQGWMNSAGHRRNILDCSFTAIGVGFDAGGNYWVQNFGR